jgi:hypothetical protein
MELLLRYEPHFRAVMGWLDWCFICTCQRHQCFAQRSRFLPDSADGGDNDTRIFVTIPMILVWGLCGLGAKYESAVCNIRKRAKFKLYLILKMFY